VLMFAMLIAQLIIVLSHLQFHLKCTYITQTLIYPTICLTFIFYLNRLHLPLALPFHNKFQKLIYLSLDWEFLESYSLIDRYIQIANILYLSLPWWFLNWHMYFPNIRLRHTMKCELGKERWRRVGFWTSEGIWTSYIPSIHPQLNYRMFSLDVNMFSQIQKFQKFLLWRFFKYK